MAAVDRRLTLEERILVVEEWLRSGKDSAIVKERFREKFPNSVPPSRQTMHNLAKKFHSTGSVLDCNRSGRPRTGRSEENVELVQATFARSPRKSQRRASSELVISRSSVQRIMKELKLRNWRPHLHQQLNEDDPDRRAEFCEWFVNICDEDENFQDIILWTDEAQFKLSGEVNKHNCVYYSTDNPHLLMQKPLNDPGVMVWGGISSFGVFGPVFFDNHVNGDNYLEIIRDIIVPQLQQSHDLDDVVWMQDGAPAHYATSVRNFLDEKFTTWIGRRGRVEWPPRSPDLTPCDFALWGTMKDKVYHTRPRNLQDLKERIREQFFLLNSNPDLLKRICRSVYGRCRICIEQEGAHFEHLI